MKEVRQTTKKYSSSKRPIYIACKNAKESTKRSQKSLGNPKSLPKTLRIASWNVHGGFHDSDKMIQVGNAFFRSKIDLLFLQEAQGSITNLVSSLMKDGATGIIPMIKNIPMVRTKTLMTTLKISAW